MEKKRIPIIAILGRPNVGKSTLFNRVVGKELAVVDDIPGVTRDRNYALVGRYEIPFYFVDTGGIIIGADSEIDTQIVEQAQAAIAEADVIVMLFDGNDGLHPDDREIVQMLRAQTKPVIFAVNKCDGVEQQGKICEFFELGFDELHALSAKHGYQVQKLVDKVFSLLPNADELRQLSTSDQVDHEAEIEKIKTELENSYRREGLADQESVEIDRSPIFAPVFEVTEGDEAGLQANVSAYLKLHRLRPLEEDRVEAPAEEELATEAPESLVPELIRLAFIGRPNVGKSTLLNAILGESRVITSSEAGTTRDAVTVPFEFKDQTFLLTDTAGLKRDNRAESLQYYSSLRTLRALAGADVAIVVIDATDGPSQHDAKILGMAHEEGVGIVLVLNKWDLVEKDHKTANEYKLRVKEVFKFAPYAEIVTTSALSGRRAPKILDAARRIAASRLRKIPTAQLNRVLKSAAEEASTPFYRGQEIKLYYGAQVAVAPPRFALFFNYPEQVHFSFIRHLKNAIRERFRFVGTDIKFVLRER
ncbi:ribosome biogenesis GTPase Der [bacterium]|nr:ribosome biogenesis GTPase Der [bacterium]